MKAETPKEAAVRRANEAYALMMSCDDDSLGPISAGRMVAEYDAMTPEERQAMYAELEKL
jgi:hypothetical protein